MAERFCRVCRDWHNLDQPWPEKCWRAVEVARSSLSFPHIISDSMGPVQSMHDGKTYDSKSTLRGAYRAAGVIEVGNDPARLRPRARPKPNRKAIRQSVEKAFAQYDSGARPRI